MFEKRYEIIKDGPKAISWDKYEQVTREEFERLLLNNGDDEECFQTFLEKNPSMVPGAWGMLGESGHYPYLGTLIAQPEIEGIKERIPDFLWLSTDSGTFAPVFIEIEAPNKRLFTSTGRTSAAFTEALGQLSEWKAIMNKPTNVQMFFEKYSIPDWLRDRKFKPHYVLIYGRRSEFENDNWLLSTRSELVRENETLMSYDRLNPDSKSQFIVCSRVTSGEYYVKNIPPTYKLGPNLAEYYSKLKDFKKAVNIMERTSEKRKAFLIERYDYWLKFSNSANQGVIWTGDYE